MINEVEESNVSNYSYETSLPAYRDNTTGKFRQMDKIITLVENGADNIAELAELSDLPASTVSGRINDAIVLGRLKYDGFVVFKDRKRKKVTIITSNV